MEVRPERTGASADGATRDVVIVGGGLAGLTAAAQLSGRDVLLLESEERLGGRISSTPRDPYWLNHGAHLFGGGSTPMGAVIDRHRLPARRVTGSLTAIGLEGRLIKRGSPAAVLTRLPMAPRDRISMLRSGITILGQTRRYQAFAECREGETPLDLNRRLNSFMNDRTFAELLGELPENVEALYRAIANRAQAPPEKLAAGAALSAFALVFSKGNMLGRAIVGGSSCLIDAMASDHQAEVVTGAEVTSVGQDEAGASVTYRDCAGTRTVRARCAIVATPSNVASRIISGLPEETASALAQIQYGPSVVLAILTNETRPMPWDRVYSAVIPGRSFNMFFNQSNVLRDGSGPRRAGGSLMIYASGALGRRILEKPDSEIRDAFLSDLHAVFPDTRGIVGETSLRRWEYATAFAHVGRAALQPALDRPLGKIFLAGDYLGAWFTDSAILTGGQAAHDADRLLNSVPYQSARSPGAPPTAPAVSEAASSPTDKGPHA